MAAAGDDVVGGDLHQRRSGGVRGPRQVGRPDRVDGEGARLVGLGGVDGGVGGAVDDDVVPGHLVGALGRVEDVQAREVGPGHGVPGRLEHRAEVLPEHAGGAGDEPPRHQRDTTCWVRAYFASVASFIGRHHASFARYHSMVAARPSRKLG